MNKKTCHNHSQLRITCDRIVGDSGDSGDSGMFWAYVGKTPVGSTIDLRQGAVGGL